MNSGYDFNTVKNEIIKFQLNIQFGPVGKMSWEALSKEKKINYYR